MKAEKITPPFHRLTEQEIRQHYKDNLINTTGYLFYIRRITCHPNKKFLIQNIVEFCKFWDIPRPSFYRAVDHLKAKGYMSWEATHGLIFTDSSKVIDFPSSDNKCLTNETRVHLRTEIITNGQVASEVDNDYHKRDSAIYIERARSSDNSDKQITTNSVVAAEDKITPEPNSQNHQPTEEEVKAAIQEISQLSPEIKTNSTVTKYVIKFWANFPSALEATKKAVREGNLKNPTGFFMEALKNPSEASKSTAIDMRNFPPIPTKEQKEQLKAIGHIDGLMITDPRYPVVFCCHLQDKDRKWHLWWEALGLDLHDLLKDNSNGT